MVKRVGLGMLGVVALLGGCGAKTPGGQVAAIVNGREVTLQEINTELQNANLPANTDKSKAQRAILQRVIERKLLVQAAEDKKLDKSAEYLSQKRRLDETLLAQAYGRQQVAAVALPTNADIDKFMADNATIFGNRQQLQLDQIRFPIANNMEKLKGIESAKTMDQVATLLTGLGIRFERSPAALDTATVPPAIMAKINALPTGEPFLVPSNGNVTINLITGRKSVANDPGQARSAAAEAWRQQKVEQLIQGQLNTLKASAKISYQNGFGPPDPTPRAKP